MHDYAIDAIEPTTMIVCDDGLGGIGRSYRHKLQTATIRERALLAEYDAIFEVDRTICQLDVRVKNLIPPCFALLRTPKTRNVDSLLAISHYKLVTCHEDVASLGDEYTRLVKQWQFIVSQNTPYRRARTQDLQELFIRDHKASVFALGLTTQLAVLVYRYRVSWLPLARHYCQPTKDTVFEKPTNASNSLDLDGKLCLPHTIVADGHAAECI